MSKEGGNFISSPMDPKVRIFFLGVLKFSKILADEKISAIS
jgi:hypothetical protein